MKCNQSRPGFELVSFPTTITITPRAPPYIYICTLNDSVGKLIISRNHFTLFWFCQLCIKLESVGLWGKQYYTTIHHSRNIETVRCTAWHSHGSSNTIISQCLDVNLRTAQRILSDLDEFTADYEGTAAQKHHYWLEKFTNFLVRYSIWSAIFSVSQW